MKTPGEMIHKAALEFRCFHCYSAPLHPCFSDFTHEGTMPCYPHESRLLAGAQAVIKRLLEEKS